MCIRLPGFHHMDDLQQQGVIIRQRGKSMFRRTVYDLVKKHEVKTPSTASTKHWVVMNKLRSWDWVYYIWNTTSGFNFLSEFIASVRTCPCLLGKKASYLWHKLQRSWFLSDLLINRTIVPRRIWLTICWLSMLIQSSVPACGWSRMILVEKLDLIEGSRVWI